MSVVPGNDRGGARHRIAGLDVAERGWGCQGSWCECKTLRRGIVLKDEGRQRGVIDGGWSLLRPDDRPCTGERTVR